jgi:response regulator RpfG family c-di-GMP phosphodiesterase
MATINCLLISEDIVFNEIIHRLICYNIKDINFISFQSFEKLKKMPDKTNIDIIILDDSIAGTASYEVISYLKTVKDINVPTYFFSPADYIEELAYSNGVNFFFKKPFEPKTVINHIISTIQSISQKRD